MDAPSLFLTASDFGSRHIIFDSVTFNHQAYRFAFSPADVVYFQNIDIATGAEFFLETGGLSGSIRLSSTSFLRLVNTILDTSVLTIEFDIASERVAVMCTGSLTRMIPQLVKVNVFMGTELPMNQVEHNALVLFVDPENSYVEQWMSRTTLNTTRMTDGKTTWILKLVTTEINGLPAISVDVGLPITSTESASPTTVFGIGCGVIAAVALIAAAAVQIKRWIQKNRRGVTIERFDGDIISDEL
jgi:hypothetical protein